jgi:hypothetical protein
MKPEKITGFRKTVSAAVIAGVLWGTHLYAASNAKLTIYQKDDEPKEYFLSSIKNVTFGSTAVGKPLANKIVHSIRFVPSSGACKFRITGIPQSNAKLSIYNLAGRELISERLVLGKDGSRTISIPAMSNGLYIVQLKNSLSTITQRFNISR